MNEYVIWSFERCQWWGPNERGYVDDLADAGRYTRHDAGRIVIDSLLLEDVGMLESIAAKRGAPKFHPFGGYVALSGAGQ